MYPEVIAIQQTAEQDLGLTVEWKKLVIALRVEQNPPPPPPTPGAFLAKHLVDFLDGLARTHVSNVKTSRVDDAFAKADAATQTQVAALLHVDIVVKPPDDVTSPNLTPDPKVPQ